jgi:hypothetical protein
MLHQIEAPRSPPCRTAAPRGWPMAYALSKRAFDVTFSAVVLSPVSFWSRPAFWPEPDPEPRTHVLPAATHGPRLPALPPVQVPHHGTGGDCGGARPRRPAGDGAHDAAGRVPAAGPVRRIAPDRQRLPRRDEPDRPAPGRPAARDVLPEPTSRVTGSAMPCGPASRALRRWNWAMFTGAPVPAGKRRSTCITSAKPGPASTRGSSGARSASWPTARGSDRAANATWPFGGAAGYKGTTPPEPAPPEQPRTETR